MTGVETNIGRLARVLSAHMNRHQTLAQLHLLAALSCAGWLHAQFPGTGGPPPNNADGPWNRDVLVYRASASGAVEKTATFERAGVPTVARMKDGRLIGAFQNFPADDNRNFDRVAVRFSSDEGRTWTAATPIVVEGMEDGLARPFDPTLVPLPDGRVRLYFTSNRSPDFRRSTPAIYSAISTDGVHYTFEPGVRFGVEGRIAIDCAVALHQGVFHLFVPDNGTAKDMTRGQQRHEPPRGGTGYHAISKDGLNFTRVEDVTVGGNRRWLGNAFSDGRQITFIGTGDRSGAWMATSADGASWQPSNGPGIGGGDPGAVRTRDGGLLILITGETVRNTTPPRMNPMQGGAQTEPGGPPDRPGEGRLQPSPRESGGRRRGFNEAVPGSEAAAQHYAKVNPDSDFTPRRGGVAAPGGPAPMRLMIARSQDGLKFERKNLIVTDQGAVPDLVVDANGWVWLYYQSCTVGDEVNKIALALSKDGGKSWTFKRVTLSGFSQPKPDPCDPEIQLLPDGTFRLYATWAEAGRPAHTFLAEARDGVNFHLVGSAFDPGAEALDPSIVKLGDAWHIFAGGGRGPGENWHGTSRDGRTFTADRSMRFTADGLNYMMANGLAAPGGARFYGFNNPRPGQPTHRIVSFFTRDGATWTADPGARLGADGLAALEEPGFGVLDPAIGRLKDGSYLMIYTTRVPGTRTQRVANQPAAPSQPEGRPPRGESSARREIRVERVESKYAVAPAAKAGSFVTGQDADLMLGGFGFNNTGGALRFNHPTGLATDGKTLLMTDRWNNRVLVWKTAPAKNTPPDLVLGQPDFTQNNPGGDTHQLNWPGNVAITPDGNRIAVTDTHNDRILIWNSFPTKNGAAADIVLDLQQLSQRGGMRFGWPWGVWTDGRTLAVVATHGAAVLIWNSPPTRDNQPPDLVLRPRNAGTPRNVTSDGTWFAVSDHNNGERSRPGTMVWRAFPTSAAQEPDFTWGEWLKGTVTPDRKLVMAGSRSIYIWDTPPRDNQTDAAVVLRPDSYRNGDGPDAVVAGGRLYVCNYNGNNVLAWNSVPARDDQAPDFALGSDAPAQDTWAESFFIQNPAVATDGRSLFVSSDFDRKLFVWRSLPDESGAKPDLVFHLPEGPWDNALHGSTLALAGRHTVYVWKTLPLDGEPPDVKLSGRIGSVELREVTGVALDDRYFYLGDRQAGAIYVWEGIPTADSEPKLTLNIERPGRLSSDGAWLAAAPFEGQSINLWRVAELRSGAQPTRLGGRGQFNLPGKCVVAQGRVFVADTCFSRVRAWERIEDALAGRPADALLGASGEQDRKPQIGRDKLFWPGSVAFGGGYLWVGEFKFSTRILRFSPRQK